MDLLQELIKAQDNLQDISFTFAGNEYKWKFRYLTLLEKVRIEQMSIKLETTYKDDGTSINKHVKQDHLIPIHTIIEKALDEDGKRLFSHTNPKHFETISMLPAGLASMVAYELSRDLFGPLTPKDEDGK
ncbi:MAG: hypothetical protein V3S80_09950 [Sulfurimonadaceae bacterium]